MDETGLCYSLAPDRTIARQQIEGAKKDKTRITIALATNADGSEKLEPLFIGRAKSPCSFKRQTGEQLGFFYRYNKKAWMTGLLFQEWLNTLERQMKIAGRNLVILDNAPSHVCENFELQYVEVLFLPPNATSKIQPLDAGIIAALKGDIDVTNLLLPLRKTSKDWTMSTALTSYRQ
jgi:DDE superfamily endonuclease